LCRRHMATVKKGQVAASKEWARHLPPVLKRLFWNAERREATKAAHKEACDG